MAAKRRRQFGRIRRLPSGNYQVRYPGPDGIDRPAAHTFEHKTDAVNWLVDKQAELRRGDWLDPDAGKITLHEFGKAWLAQRVDLARTTHERYESAFRLHVCPELGGKALTEITPEVIRTWHAGLLTNGVEWPSAAKAYRTLRVMFNTAVDDGRIRRNPCRIKGAGADRSPERPTLTVDEVAAVMAKIDKRYQAMVLLAAFTTLRLGELAALRRRDVDLIDGWVHVRRGQVELSTGELLVKDPKSEAGKRRVGIPSDLLRSLRWHVETFAEPGPDGRLFIGPKGGYIRRQNFRRLWIKALKAVGLTDVHFHDLRHTGNTLAAASGANLRELMERMGHASTRAAVIYLHAANGRDRQIADSLNGHLKGIMLPGAQVADDNRAGT
ncbi:tyrosine-type recombinase/integrase [Jiangella asiatica]|uniref:Site-specific integrase n=1 Tax=Jiangella asiatica TaxID=2530372 RepID=A0A4R5DFA2_9ACTN|nr:site-specific integrase [Jiangella asiatica]TDE12622.1 site-specific integrase [Jiangella asiatica]